MVILYIKKSLALIFSYLWDLRFLASRFECQDGLGKVVGDVKTLLKELVNFLQFLWGGGKVEPLPTTGSWCVPKKKNNKRSICMLQLNYLQKKQLKHAWQLQTICSRSRQSTKGSTAAATKPTNRNN